MNEPPRLVRRALGALGATLTALVLAAPASAHGGVTGPQDVVQDYGVLLFLLATVLIGAGVLAWVTFSPQEGEEDLEDEPDGQDPPVPVGAVPPEAEARRQPEPVSNRE